MDAWSVLGIAFFWLLAAAEWCILQGVVRELTEGITRDLDALRRQIVSRPTTRVMEEKS